MTCDIVTSARLLIVAMNDWELDKYMVTHYRPECKEEQKKKKTQTKTNHCGGTGRF